MLYVCQVDAQEQLLTGEVLAQETKEPIVGAVVFYDGSSIGTITDIDGKFRLLSKTPTNSPLVIRSLGFETITLPKLDSDVIRVFMKPAAIQLPEVTLEPDTWSRKKKLKVFRRELLGVGHKCDILNEDDVRLYYNKGKKTLYAFANRPLKIKNKGLEYLLVYDVTDFEVNLYEDSASPEAVKQVFYAGNTQFIDESNGSASALRRRKKAYFGSSLHFFRALYSNRLEQEGFQLFKKRFKVPAQELFGFKTVDATLYVSKLDGLGRISILYGKRNQSFLEVKTAQFIIDPLGNYAPTNALLFGGEMGKHRINTMLPIDYEVKD
ncbi:Hypothetical protein I595_1927 [Croceitalea dokdonensis DOKDO 023]|uniref:Carboxypeptidase-like regulatory domain-containing protein n=1 Tax=Croceitalea dokdonensis DOKDO 023 TaxID=1300341 RepID=A0A0P7B064_9FLAO|nr:carboxypeptidase-like regulatory domain-containing protein [Croceitalea dokdonensis]KPM32277.1 Hypothetical protein I595_1927 [Croceitalea dokdonensis DOKDO 023]